MILSCSKVGVCRFRRISSRSVLIWLSDIVSCLHARWKGVFLQFDSHWYNKSLMHLNDLVQILFCKLQKKKQKKTDVKQKCCSSSWSIARLHICLYKEMCSGVRLCGACHAEVQVRSEHCGEEEGCTFVISQRRTNVWLPHPPFWCCRVSAKQQQLWPSSVFGLHWLPVFRPNTSCICILFGAYQPSACFITIVSAKWANSSKVCVYIDIYLYLFASSLSAPLCQL